MKKKLQPFIANVISSQWLLKLKRRLHEAKRKLSATPHEVLIFIRVDDPYSYLLLQVMPELERRYDVRFTYHVVSHLQDGMYPEPELWHENALRDAAHIAELYQLDLPSINTLPSAEQSQLASNHLLALEHDEQFSERAIEVLKAYWHALPTSATGVGLVDASEKLKANDALLDSLGHYLSGTLYYAGEWYWGIDRLNHLEARLNDLNLSRLTDIDGSAEKEVNTEISKEIKYQESTKHFCNRLKSLNSYPKRPDTPLIIYFSARSPYSYLGLERGVSMATYYQIPIIIKPVLPMMMRGMNVPARKKWYIFSDTKREALNLNIDYGFVADPLGIGVERCYSLFEYAKQQGKEVDYLLSFARAVNAKGIHSDTDQGMQTIVENAGLNWSNAKPILEQQFTSQGWRGWAEENYHQMHSLGLWGVPCFQYGEISVWGQDRVDVIERAICDAIVLVNE